MTAYAVMWRVPPAATAAAVASVVTGVSLGLLSLEIRFQEQNLLAATHPIEHMFVFASWASPGLADEPQILNPTLFGLLVRGTISSMVEHASFLHPSHRPTLLLEWLAIVGSVVLWRRGDRAAPVQVGMLLMLAWGLDALSTLRGHSPDMYFIYSDPLLIIAAALVAARFPQMHKSLPAQILAVCLFSASIVWAHTQPGTRFSVRAPPVEPCSWLTSYLKGLDGLPFCRPEAGFPLGANSL
jgi:hypothetical protein